MRTQVCTGQDARATFHAVDEAIAAGLRPTLALVFCSVSVDFAAIGRGLSERGLTTIGATTAGEIAGDDLLDESSVVLLLELARDAFHVYFDGTGPGRTLYDLGRALAQQASTRFHHPALLTFVSGIRSDAEQVVCGVRDGASEPIPMFGGVAADDLAMENSYVFANGSVSEEGVVALVLDGARVDVQGIAANGWQAVGIEKTITRSEANVVYTIDGQPAFDIYRKYLKTEVVLPDKPGTVTALTIGISYPLSLRRSNGTSVIRAPLFYQPETQSMIFAGSMPQGGKVRFCIPPSLDIVERVVREAKDVRNALPTADALILVSCKARQLALGPLVTDEIQQLRALWGAPMAGFFSCGEIGARDPRHLDFHTETCILVALRAIGD